MHPRVPGRSEARFWRRIRYEAWRERLEARRIRTRTRREEAIAALAHEEELEKARKLEAEALRRRALAASADIGGAHRAAAHLVRTGGLEAREALRAWRSSASAERRRARAAAGRLQKRERRPRSAAPTAGSTPRASPALPDPLSLPSTWPKLPVRHLAHSSREAGEWAIEEELGPVPLSNVEAAKARAAVVRPKNPARAAVASVALRGGGARALPGPVRRSRQSISAASAEAGLAWLSKAEKGLQQLGRTVAVP